LIIIIIIIIIIITIGPNFFRLQFLGELMKFMEKEKEKKKM